MDGIDLHTFGNNQVSQVAALKQIDIAEYHIKRIKEIEDNCQTKTDSKDNPLIVKLVRDGDFFDPNLAGSICGAKKNVQTQAKGQ